jgi:hypothetical protein
MKITAQLAAPKAIRPARKAVDIQPAGQVQDYGGGRDGGDASLGDWNGSTDQRVSFVPLLIRRRQHRKLLIAPPRLPGQPVDTKLASAFDSALQGKPSFDLALIRTLGKAFYWQKLLDSGQVSTITQLALQLQLEAGWVAEVLRMTRLAPDIVQAVMEGKQPRHLNLHALRGRQSCVPLDWQAQRELFGFCG